MKKKRILYVALATVMVASGLQGNVFPSQLSVVKAGENVVGAGSLLKKATYKIIEDVASSDEKKYQIQMDFGSFYDSVTGKVRFNVPNENVNGFSIDTGAKPNIKIGNFAIGDTVEIYLQDTPDDKYTFKLQREPNIVLNQLSQIRGTLKVKGFEKGKIVWFRPEGGTEHDDKTLAVKEDGSINFSDSSIEAGKKYELRYTGTPYAEYLPGDLNEKTITHYFPREEKVTFFVKTPVSVLAAQLKKMSYQLTEKNELVISDFHKVEEGDEHTTTKIQEISYAFEGESGRKELLTEAELENLQGVEKKISLDGKEGKTVILYGEKNGNDHKLTFQIQKEVINKDSITVNEGTKTLEGFGANGGNHQIRKKANAGESGQSFADITGNTHVVTDYGTYEIRKKSGVTKNFDNQGDGGTIALNGQVVEITVVNPAARITTDKLKNLTYTIGDDGSLIVGNLNSLKNSIGDLKYRIRNTNENTGDFVAIDYNKNTSVTLGNVVSGKTFEIQGKDENTRLSIDFSGETIEEAKKQQIKQVKNKLEIVGIGEGEISAYEIKGAAENAFKPISKDENVQNYTWKDGKIQVGKTGRYSIRKKGFDKVIRFTDGNQMSYKFPSEVHEIEVEKFDITKEDLKKLSFTVEEGKLIVGNLKTINENSKDLKYQLADGREQTIDFKTKTEEVIAGISEGKTFSLYEGANKLQIVFEKEAVVDDETKKNVKQFEKELAIVGIKEAEASKYEISDKKDSAYKEVELVAFSEKNKKKVVKVTKPGTYYIRKKSTTPTIQFGNKDSFTYKFPSDVMEVVLKSKIQDAPSYFPEVSVEPKKEEPKKEEPKKEEPKKEEPKKEEPKKEEPKKEQSKEEMTQKETVKEVVEVVKSAKKNKITVKEDKIQNVLESENGSLKVSLKNLGLTFSKETLRNFVQDMAKKFDVGLKIVTLKKSTKGKTGKDYSLASRKNFKVTLKVDGKSADELDLQGKKVKVSLSVKLKNQRGKLYVMDLKTGKKHSAKYKNGKLTFATDKLGSFIVVKRQAKKKV